MSDNFLMFLLTELQNVGSFGVILNNSNLFIIESRVIFNKINKTCFLERS